MSGRILYGPSKFHDIVTLIDYCHVVTAGKVSVFIRYLICGYDNNIHIYISLNTSDGTTLLILIPTGIIYIYDLILQMVPHH